MGSVLSTCSQFSLVYIKDTNDLLITVPNLPGSWMSKNYGSQETLCSPDTSPSPGAAASAFVCLSLCLCVIEFVFTPELSLLRTQTSKQSPPIPHGRVLVLPKAMPLTSLPGDSWVSRARGTSWTQTGSSAHPSTCLWLHSLPLSTFSSRHQTWWPQGLGKLPVALWPRIPKADWLMAWFP